MKVRVLDSKGFTRGFIEAAVGMVTRESGEITKANEKSVQTVHSLPNRVWDSSWKECRQERPSITLAEAKKWGFKESK